MTQERARDREADQDAAPALAGLTARERAARDLGGPAKRSA